MTPAEIAESHLVLEGVDPDLQGKPQRFLIFLRALPRGEGPCRMTWLGESTHERGAEGVRGSAVLTLTAILERAERLRDRQQYIEDNAPALVVALEAKVARQTEELRRLNQRCEALLRERDHQAKIVQSLADRVAAQSELLSKKAEKGVTP